MKRLPQLLLAGLGFVLALAAQAASPAPPAPAPPTSKSQALMLAGPATNTTAGVAANVTLTLTIDGEKVTGTMKTEAPLAGSGRIEGLYRGGWCELTGKLDEGFQIRLCGVYNGNDFRGTYIVVVPGALQQYGRFQLAVKR